MPTRPVTSSTSSTASSSNSPGSIPGTGRGHWARSPFPGFKGQPPIPDVDNYLSARRDLAGEEHPGELVIDLSLDGTAHRPRPEFRLVTMLGQPVDRGRRES